MEEKIIITPSSRITADLTPIVILDENTRSRLKFEIMQVDNQKNKEHKLRGKLIYTKKNKDNSFDGVEVLNKQSISSGQSFELSLSTSQTYALWQKLTEYYNLVEDKLTPLQETSYVKESEEIKLLKKTLTNKEACEIIKKIWEGK